MLIDKKRISFKTCLLYIVATIAFIVMGIVFINIGVKEQQRTKDWPTVDAKITGLIEHKKDDRYEYEVYITYKIDDENHINVKINQFDGSVMKSDTIITVKYNPSNHEEVVYGNPGFNVFPIIGGASFLVIGLTIPTVFIILKIRKKKEISE